MKPSSLFIPKERRGLYPNILSILLLRSRWKNQQGATLIEALVTIAILAILVVAASPPIVLSVAARVRARQIESASQTAQNYIDGLNSGTILPPMQYVYCTGAAFPSGSVPTIQSMNSTNSAITVSSAGTLQTFMPPLAQPTDQGTLVDMNGNGQFNDPQDFRIQAIRTVVPNPKETAITDATQRALRVQEAGYSLIVRVYRGDASLTIPLGTQEVKTIFTANTDKGTAFRNNPLVEIRTHIRGRRVNLPGMKDQSRSLWSTNPTTYCP